MPGHQVDLQQAEVRSWLPARARPEFYSFGIIGKDEDVALLDACLTQFLQTPIDQLAAQACSPVACCHRQVMKVAPPAVVPTQDGANQPALSLRHETEARVSS
jgi:hypothetical protein